MLMVAKPAEWLGRPRIDTACEIEGWLYRHPFDLGGCGSSLRETSCNAPALDPDLEPACCRNGAPYFP